MTLGQFPPQFRGDRWTAAGATNQEVPVLQTAFYAATQTLQLADNIAMEGAATGEITVALLAMRAANAYTLFIGVNPGFPLTGGGGGGGGINLPAGDLGGTDLAPTVTGIRGYPVRAATPTTGQVMASDGTHWKPTTIPGSAGGTVTEITTTTPLDIAITNEFGPIVTIDFIGGGGGGGGGAGAATAMSLAIGNGPTLAQGVGTGYTPSVDDVIYMVDFTIDTAYTGGMPAYLDFGTLTASGVKGILADMNLPPIPLSYPDIQLPDNAGLAISGIPSGPGTQSPSWQAALISEGIGGLLPVVRAIMKALAANELFIIVSQDGTATDPATTAVLTFNNPISPAPSSGNPVVVTNTNNQYQLIPATQPGAGPPTALNFTVANNTSPGYTSLGALEAALNAATTVISGTPTAFHPTFGTWGDNGSGALTVTAPVAGGYWDQATIGPPASGNDITVGLGLTMTGILTGGAGGDPAVSAGACTLYVLAATPVSIGAGIP